MLSQQYANISFSSVYFCCFWAVTCTSWHLMICSFVEAVEKDYFELNAASAAMVLVMLILCTHHVITELTVTPEKSLLFPRHGCRQIWRYTSDFASRQSPGQLVTQATAFGAAVAVVIVRPSPRERFTKDLITYSGVSIGSYQKLKRLNHNKILHMSRQHCCLDMCKISLWSRRYNVQYRELDSSKISSQDVVTHSEMLPPARVFICIEIYAPQATFAIAYSLAYI